MTTLDTLTRRFLDDQSELSAEELDELIAGLRADPARAVGVREQLVVDFLLADKLTLDRRNFLAQVQQRIADFEQQEDEIDTQVVELRELAAAEIELPAQRHRQSVWVQGVLAAGLLAVVAAFFVVPTWLPRSPVAIAKVKEIDGTVTATKDAKSARLAKTATLFAGQQIAIPADSSLEIEYADKSIVRIAGDSLVALESEVSSGAKRLSIERGQLWASVAPQTDGPMQLATPHAVAVVIGTQFTLSVGPDDTLLQVTQGKVRLDRLDGSNSILVAAKQYGLATAEILDLRTVEWPISTDGLALAFDPFTRRPGQVHNLATGKWYAAEWQVVGSAALNDFTEEIELSGGYFLEPDAGKDLAAVCQPHDELTLEIVLTPAARQPSGSARILSLEGSDGSANFVLGQDGNEWTFALKTDGAGSGSPVRVPCALGQTTHLTITYKNDSLTIYQGNQIALENGSIAGTLSNWTGGPLVIGATSGGEEVWRGSLEAIAVYHRCLPAAEVAQNVRQFRLLSGRPGLP